MNYYKRIFVHNLVLSSFFVFMEFVSAPSNHEIMRE